MDVCRAGAAAGGASVSAGVKSCRQMGQEVEMYLPSFDACMHAYLVARNSFGRSTTLGIASAYKWYDNRMELSLIHI